MHRTRKRKKMAKCRTCEELNEETKDVYICGIKIGAAGYFSWHRKILYCPTCGKRIIHKTESEE